MLCEHLDQFGIAYLDDIVIYPYLFEVQREHTQLVQANFRRLVYNFTCHNVNLKCSESALSASMLNQQVSRWSQTGFERLPSSQN